MDKATAEDTDGTTSGKKEEEEQVKESTTLLTASFQKLPGELAGEPALQPAHQGKSCHNAKEARFQQQELPQKGEVLLQPQTLWQVQQIQGQAQ